MSDYPILSDPELFMLLKDGDSAAFSEIYQRYVHALLSHAYNKTRDREMAKDVVQETFTNLWARKDAIEINRNLSGFLYTSVRNSILNQIAHLNVKEKYITSMLRCYEDGHVITDHLVREKQFAQLIEKEIAGLTPKMRTVFTLSRKEHLSHREIAEKLHLSEQTVSKHITNALHTLRLKLGALLFLILIIIQK